MSLFDVVRDLVKYCAIPSSIFYLWFWFTSKTDTEEQEMRRFMTMHGPVIGVLGMTSFTIGQILIPGSTTGPFSLLFISLFGVLSITRDQLLRFKAEVSKWVTISMVTVGMFFGQAPQISSDKEIKRIKDRLCALESKYLKQDDCIEKNHNSEGS